MRKAVEASLARLRTDVIDLYQMHFPDPKTAVEETLGALAELVSEGKVRAFGCSNFTGAMIDPRFATAQNEWSLLVRKAEADVIPACEKHGVAQLPYFPLASGMLSGKYHRGEPLPAGSRLAGGGSYFDGVKTDANFDKVEKLRAFAADHGRSLLELAISWLAAQPSVGSVIAGATSAEQVRANAAAASWKMTRAELDGDRPRSRRADSWVRTPPAPGTTRDRDAVHGHAGLDAEQRGHGRVHVHRADVSTCRCPRRCRRPRGRGCPRMPGVAGG